MAKAAEAFRTISEVADELELQKHVLRFWEVKFPQIKPMKRGGGRRYYRPADLELLRGIRHLLHADGYTIKGVQRILRERGIDVVKCAGAGVAAGGKVQSVNSDASAPGNMTDGARAASLNHATAEEALSQGSAAARSATAARKASSKHTGSARTDNIVSAIAELQACRAILMGAKAQDTATGATPKRPMRAAG
jgi:DNA-binding transcriptional MerR regulator